MGTIAKPPIYKVTLAQLLIAVITSALFALVDLVKGYSFLIGCLIQIGGSAYFARLAFRYRGARQVRTMVQAMYLGESGKILLSAVIFAAVFILVKPLSAVLVFAGYIAMAIVHAVLAANLIKHKMSHFSNRP